ncbi:MAG: ferritin-like domain-containing protein [Clostridia bacterium]|nr:ferritin-like domain-containing protein [Clostridia bacterium]
MYPYNTNTNANMNTNASRKKKSIKATRKDFPEPLNNNDSLSQLFSAAMLDETKDAAKYRGMMEYLSKNGLDNLAEVAKSMYADECRHRTLLKNMADTDGIMYNEPGEITDEFDYTPEGILQDVYAEVEGARFYRDFARVLQNEDMGDIETLDEIMNDEQNHAVLNDYIYLNMLNMVNAQSK